jgi:hypothetical protein
MGGKLYASGLVLLLCGVVGCQPEASHGPYQAVSENRLVDTKTGEVYEGQWSNGTATWQKRFARPDTTQPAMPATPNVVSPSPDSSQLFGNASIATGLNQELAALKSAKDEGNLTDDEYKRARAQSFARFQSTLEQSQVWMLPATRVHDELALLNQMKKDGHLNADEYEQLRATLVKGYLSASEH